MSNTLAVGRPPSTTHGQLDRVILDLFTEKGFEKTSVSDIASLAGISRRTFFRYFTSKADAVWGEFDTGLANFRHELTNVAEDVPIMTALREAVVRFNTFPLEEAARHRQRMRLILGEPALLAHSTLRYAQWREGGQWVVAHRLGLAPEALLPRTIGHFALGASMAAYEEWLSHDDSPLEPYIYDSFEVLAGAVSL